MPRNPSLGLARTLRDYVFKVTGGQRMKWVMVGELGLRHPDTAIATLDAAWRWKGWRTGEGKPVHSVCLTDDGRGLAEER